MLAPTPFATPHSQMYPALYLYPRNESFVPKHISLVGGLSMKIGRQTNAKTVPGERNGYFDSKVLSRQHAEIWEETGKIFIKNVKSSNGTFINGERLSPEGMESDPWELKSDDIVVRPSLTRSLVYLSRPRRNSV
ncbi:Centrosomal and Immune Signaling Modulator, partial [Pleurotus pulmonarius]